MADDDIERITTVLAAVQARVFKLDEEYTEHKADEETEFRTNREQHQAIITRLDAHGLVLKEVKDLLDTRKAWRHVIEDLKEYSHSGSVLFKMLLWLLIAGGAALYWITGHLPGAD